MKNRPVTNDGTQPISPSTGPVVSPPAAIEARPSQRGDSGPTVPVSGNPTGSAGTQPVAPAVSRSGSPSGSQVVSQTEATPADQRADPGSNPAPTFDPLANGPQPPALEPRLAAVATIADPHLRQHVEANVRLQTQRQITAFTDAQRQAKAQAKQVIDQGGDLSSIPAKLMLQIDTPGRQALRDYVLAHGNPATDPATYYGLKNQALDDPAAFQAVDLGNHMARLKPSDYAELQQLQTSLKNNQPPADLPLQQAYKANTDFLLQQLGLPTVIAANPNPAANDNRLGAQQAALVRRAIDQHVAATELATGRKMTPDDHHDLLQQVSAFQQPQVPLATSASPIVAGTTTPALTSAWGAKGAAEAEEVGELATGGEALAGSSLMATLAPILGLSASMLAVTATPTANPALDEYQSPITTELPSSPGMPLPIIQERKKSGGGGKGIDCDEEYAACVKMCFGAIKTRKDTTKGLYHTGLGKCMKGCLPVGCGGNAPSRSKR